VINLPQSPVPKTPATSKYWTSLHHMQLLK